MIIEYILVGVVCFTIGVNSSKQKHKCEHNDKIVVVHKHKKRKKFRHKPLLRRKHIHIHHSINTMCRSR